MIKFKSENTKWIIAIIVLICLAVGIGLHNKVTTGCYSFSDEKKTSTYSLIKDYGYSCENLENMIILEVYPQNLNITETHFYCMGKDAGLAEHRPFSYYDIKNEYAQYCLR